MSIARKKKMRKQTVSDAPSITRLKQQCRRALGGTLEDPNPVEGFLSMIPDGSATVGHTEEPPDTPGVQDENESADIIERCGGEY